jgi:hypothetical protein
MVTPTPISPGPRQPWSRESREWQGGDLDVAEPGHVGQVAGLDRDVLGCRAIAVPVRQPKDPVTHTLNHVLPCLSSVTTPATSWPDEHPRLCRDAV